MPHVYACAVYAKLIPVKPIEDTYYTNVPLCGRAQSDYNIKYNNREFTTMSGKPA